MIRNFLLFVTIAAILNTGCKNESEEKNLRQEVGSLKVRNDSLTEVIKSNKDKVQFAEMLDSYGVEVLQIGGIGSFQVQIQAYYLNEVGYLENPKSRIQYFFNNAGDILWVSPVAGYFIDKISRDFKNEKTQPVDFDKLTGSCGLKLFDQMQNKFFIVMKKGTFEKYLKDKKENEDYEALKKKANLAGTTK